MLSAFDHLLVVRARLLRVDRHATTCEPEMYRLFLLPRDWGRATGSVDGAANQGSFYGTFLGFFLLFSMPFEQGLKMLFIIYAVFALGGALLIWMKVPETLSVSRSKDVLPDSDRLDRGGIARLMAIVFLTGISYAMISPLLMIFLQDKFTGDVRTLATVFIPAALVYSFLPGRLGNLSDRFGRAPLMAFGLVLAGVVSLFMPGLNSLLVLSVLWVMEALGFVMAAPAESALVADLTGRMVRGRGYGMYTFAQGMGWVVGPVLGGWLYDATSHAVPFYLNGILLFMGAGLVPFLLKWNSIRECFLSIQVSTLCPALE